SQQVLRGSFSYFGKKFELLTESTVGLNHTDTTGTRQTLASYLYSGYKISQKLIPYIRVDDLHYQAGEMLFTKDNTTSFILGVRYQINYMAVVKLEYQHIKQEIEGTNDRLTMQFAIGF